MVAALTQFVEHVEGDNHRHIHVDELGGQIEIALEIAGINHVDDDVWMFLDDVFTHIEFFGCIGRERIGAWQIDKVEVIALEVEVSHLGIDRHAGVVAHPFMGSAGDVEQRGFSTIGIAHKDNIEFMFLDACHTLHNVLAVVSKQRVQVGVRCLPRLGLFFVDYLHHVGLGSAKTDLIIHNLVLHRVVQGGIEQHLHRLALDETHLDNTFAEAAVSHHADNDARLSCFQLR